MTAVRKAIQNITDIFTKEQTEILKTAGMLMVPALLTKITGQIYYMLIATQLGTEKEIEHFNLASTIPEALLNILLLGVVGVVVIPIFIEVKEKRGMKYFLELYYTVLNLAVGLFAIVSLLMLIFADSLFPMLFQLMLPAGSEQAISVADMKQIISLMQFLMLPNLILAVSVIISSGLQAFHRIFVPHLAPLFFNVGRIFGVFVLLPAMDNSPWALAYGVMIGSVLHLLVQVPLASLLELKYKPVLAWRNPEFRQVLKVSVPRGVAFAAETISLTILRLAATGLGAITVFNYANSLALVVPSLFGSSFAFASYPTLSTLYARKKYDEIGQIVVRTINQIVFLSLPFVLAIIILRLPAVRLVYGLVPGTAFDRQDTLFVGWALLFFSVGIIFTASKWYLYRLFYVAQNTWVPLIISVIALIITVVLGSLLSNLFSHSSSFSLWELNLRFEHLFEWSDGKDAIGGLILGYSIANIIEFFLLLFLVNKMVIKLNLKQLGAGLLRKFVPAVCSGALMFFMFKTWDTATFPIDATTGFVGSTTFNLFILTSITAGTSFLVYYLLCYLFQVEELKILRRLLNPIFRLGGLEI